MSEENKEQNETKNDIVDAIANIDATIKLLNKKPQTSVFVETVRDLRLRLFTLLDTLGVGSVGSGQLFRCECKCGIFTKFEINNESYFKCNACGATYAQEQSK
jgi:hypothetical protein